MREMQIAAEGSDVVPMAQKISAKRTMYWIKCRYLSSFSCGRKTAITISSDAKYHDETHGEEEDPEMKQARRGVVIIQVKKVPHNIASEDIREKTDKAN